MKPLANFTETFVKIFEGKLFMYFKRETQKFTNFRLSCREDTRKISESYPGHLTLCVQIYI